MLELNTKPPAEWNLYYAGWDRTTTPASSAMAIHHPKGDVMKISQEQRTLVNVDWNYSGVLNHLGVQHFEQGTVQPGSSGSLLFNQDKRIVGQLHGTDGNPCMGLTGNAQNTCNCQNPRGEYGRFDVSWSGGGTLSTRLFDFLSPLGTAYNTLDGIREPFINGPSVIFYSGITFSLFNPPPGTITWEVTGPFSLSTTTGSSTVVSKTTTTSGSGALRARVNGIVVAELFITAYHVVINGSDLISSGGNYSYWVPAISGATYLWDDGQQMTVSSVRHEPVAIYNVPYGASSHDYVGCTVTVNGVSTYVYMMVYIL